MCWICAEAIVFAASGAVVGAQLAERQGRIGTSPWLSCRSG